MTKIKDIDYRLKELKDSLEILENANNGFWNDGMKNSYLIMMMTQVRALVGMGRNMAPLLLNLMDDLKSPTIVYSFGAKSNENSNEKIIAHMYADRTWYVNSHPKLRGYSLRSWLNVSYQSLTIKGVNKFYTRNDILRGIADKHGSHFDPDISEYVEELERHINSNGLNGKSLFLLDVTSAIVYCGEQLLNIYEARKQRIPLPNFSPIKQTEKKFADFDFGFPLCEMQITKLETTSSMDIKS